MSAVPTATLHPILKVHELAWPPMAHVHLQLARAAEALLMAALPSRERAASTLAEAMAILDGQPAEVMVRPPLLPLLHAIFSAPLTPCYLLRGTLP